MDTNRIRSAEQVRRSTAHGDRQSSVCRSRPLHRPHWLPLVRVVERVRSMAYGDMRFSRWGRKGAWERLAYAVSDETEINVCCSTRPSCVRTSFDRRSKRRPASSRSDARVEDVRARNRTKGALADIRISDVAGESLDLGEVVHRPLRAVQFNPFALAPRWGRIDAVLESFFYIEFRSLWTSVDVNDSSRNQSAFE